MNSSVIFILILAAALPFLFIFGIKFILKKMRCTKFEPAIALVLIVVGVGQFIAFGYSIFTLYCLIVLGFCGGFLGGTGGATGQSDVSNTLKSIDSNLSQIKFIEQMKQQRDIYDRFTRK